MLGKRMNLWITSTSPTTTLWPEYEATMRAHQIASGTVVQLPPLRSPSAVRRSPSLSNVRLPSISYKNLPAISANSHAYRTPREKDKLLEVLPRLEEKERVRASSAHDHNPPKNISSTRTGLGGGSSTESSNVKSKSVSKKIGKRGPRTYQDAKPSQYCHICARLPSEDAPHMFCANVAEGKCRKSTCQKCYAKYEMSAAVHRDCEDGRWICSHCAGTCPKRSQCHIYNRTSERRRTRNWAKKVAKAKEMSG